MADIKIERLASLENKLGEIAKKLGKKGSVRVGFLEGATYTDGTSVPMVAAIQEYGAPSVGIPPRPFFRHMVDTKSPKWGNLVEAAAKMTDYDGAKTLAIVGEKIKAQLQESIRDFHGEELSKTTLILRGKFWNNPEDITFKDVQDARELAAQDYVPELTAGQRNPLVWTGHLMNSVDYEVKDE